MVVDVEPDLSIDTPADAALFESRTETEVQKKEEEIKKKKKEAEVKKVEEAPKKKEELLTKKKEESPKKKEAIQKATKGEPKKERNPGVEEEEETTKSGESKRRGEEVHGSAAKRKVEDPIGSLPGPSTEHRRTSSHRPGSTSRDESPHHTVPSWEWREFLDYRRPTSSRPPFKKYK